MAQSITVLCCVENGAPWRSGRNSISLDCCNGRRYLALPILMNRSAVRAASWRGISRVDWASAAFL